MDFSNGGFTNTTLVVVVVLNWNVLSVMFAYIINLGLMNDYIFNFL